MSGLSHVHRQALSPPHPDRRPAKVTSERMSRAGACDNRSMLDKSDAKDKNAGRHTPFPRRPHAQPFLHVRRSQR